MYIVNIFGFFKKKIAILEFLYANRKFVYKLLSLSVDYTAFLVNDLAQYLFITSFR